MKRIFIRFLTLCLTFVMLGNVCVLASSTHRVDDGVAAWYSVSAESYCLMDADSGDVLFASRENQRLPMASTTKIMTCLVALEEGDIHSEVIIPSEAVGVEGSSIYLSKGEKLSLLELLYGLMLESANDAAVAIALHVSGSVSKFAELMNDKASALGMVNTNFTNPNGLPDDGHYSSAYDLSLLMCAAMKNDVFADISSTQTKNISAPDGKTRFLSNHNRLLRSYEDCVAGKTGYTKIAGRCLVTAAKRDGKMLICSTLGAPDDWQDHKQLFSKGFSLYNNRILLESGSYNGQISVVGGMSSSVNVTNRDAFSYMLRQDENVKTVVEMPVFLYAPVAQGDTVGYLVFMRGETELGKTPLYSVEKSGKAEVKLSFWQKLWNKICEWFQ